MVFMIISLETINISMITVNDIAKYCVIYDVRTSDAISLLKRSVLDDAVFKKILHKRVIIKNKTVTVKMI